MPPPQSFFSHFFYFPFFHSQEFVALWCGVVFDADDDDELVHRPGGNCRGCLHLQVHRVQGVGHYSLLTPHPLLPPHLLHSSHLLSPHSLFPFHPPHSSYLFHFPHPPILLILFCFSYLSFFSSFSYFSHLFFHRHLSIFQLLQ